MALFRHTHLRKTPAGSRVRTLVRGKHRLRVAFPKGPRRKGAGKLIEILHPRTENPRLCRVNPAELVILGNPNRRKRNSAKGAQLYEEFHGKEAASSQVVSEPQEMPKEAVVLGDLVEMNVIGPKGLTKISFAGDDVKLTSNTGGSQLYFVGGDQRLMPDHLHTFGLSANGHTLRLGRADSIVYQARKAMDGFQVSDYKHEFGEEGGTKPTLYFDPKINRLYLEGGSYRVEAPGIIN
jgi:hypothetical protein